LTWPGGRGIIGWGSFNDFWGGSAGSFNDNRSWRPVIWGKLGKIRGMGLMMTDHFPQFPSLRPSALSHHFQQKCPLKLDDLQAIGGESPFTSSLLINST
jgi:hypothetical protein